MKPIGLADYQSLLEFVHREFSDLVVEVEMLKPTLSVSFRHESFASKRLFGIDIIMFALLNQCLIRAHRLLDGNGGLWNRTRVKPSLRVLVEPFLKQKQPNQRYEKWLKELAHKPPDRPDVILHLQCQPLSDSILNEPRQPDRRSAEEREQDFWVRVERIRDDWTFLEDTRQELEAPRNQIAAHVHLRSDTIEFVDASLQKNIR
jgi:hypothetical protein